MSKLVFIADPPYVRCEVALPHGLGCCSLTKGWRLAFHQITRTDKGWEQRLGYGDVTDTQARKKRLVEGVDIDRSLVGSESLVRCKR